MKLATETIDWTYGELFTRLDTIFSWEVGDGSSLVFTKLDFWLFFLMAMAIFAFMSLKWFRTVMASVLILGLGFLSLYALPKQLIGSFPHVFWKGDWIHMFVWALVTASLASLLIVGVARSWSVKAREELRSFVLGNKKMLLRSIFLTLVSLFFFYKTSGLYMLLLVISVGVNYSLGNRIFRAQSPLRRKWIIAFSAIFNLLILGYFKYAYFFTDSFNQMFHTDFELVNHFAQFANGFFDSNPALHYQFGNYTFVDKILLPVGVSFFTFQNISYVVDIYRKEIKPVRNVFHYSFFVTFFPQLVMGPIVRARDFIPQITQPFHLDKEGFSWAVIQIMKGLVKKIVIADFLVVHFIDKILFTETFTFDTYPGFVFVIVMWAYSIHIYADFSGYTDIAIGLSRLMGFKLKPNFNSPYKAVSVADFWRRWHMSLGSWLRDYLYIPLGGNRTGTMGSYIAIVIIFTFLIFITQWYDLLWVYLGVTIVYLLGVAFIKDFKRYVHRDLNLIITMVVGGLWHGASENFVIWGAMNGCALLVFKYWSRITKWALEKNRWWHLLRPIAAYGLYHMLVFFYPPANHELVNLFFILWIGSNIVAYGLNFAWKPFIDGMIKWSGHRKIFYGFLPTTLLYAVLLLFFPSWYNALLFEALFAVSLITGIATYLTWESRDGNLYERTKSRYLRFWPMLITFNFITFTRIWFKLDEARQSPFEEKGLDDTAADLLPGKLLDRIWNNFEFSWEYFWKFWDLFYIPIIIMIAGFIVHWLPERLKSLYEKAYTSLPIPVQAVCIVVIVFLLYQAIGTKQPPFVYLQF